MIKGFRLSKKNIKLILVFVVLFFLFFSFFLQKINYIYAVNGMHAYPGSVDYSVEGDTIKAGGEAPEPKEEESSWLGLDQAPAYFIATILWVIAYLTTNYLLELGKTILQLIINFTNSLSYTQNDIVIEGIKITTNFVNIILVLALVFIALATILRIKEYSAQKLLVGFIIVALLVNFANVITGLVIDATNIVTNHFLFKVSLEKDQEKDQDNLWEKSACQSGWGWGDGKDIIAERGAMSCGLLIISSIFGFITYILFSIIFLARIMVLWVLVILAPIAFACYVLPATKRFWEQWRDLFVQWTTIGIIASFFLYLANNIALSSNALNEIQKSFNTAEEGSIQKKSLGILTPIIPAAFYIISLFFALSVTSSIKEKVKKGTQKGIPYLKTAAVATGLAWAGKQLAGRITASKGYQKIMTGLAGGRWGAPTAWQKAKGQTGIKGVVAKAGAGALYGPLTAGSWVTRRLGQAGLKARTSQEKRIENLEPEMESLLQGTKGMDKDARKKAIQNIYNGFGRFSYDKKIAFARVLMKQKDYGNLSQDQQKEVIKLSAQFNPSETANFAKANPTFILDPDTRDIVAKSTGITIKKDPKTGKPAKGALIDAMENLIEKIKPSQMANISDDSFDISSTDSVVQKKAQIFLDALIAKGDRRQFEQLYNTHGRKFADKFEVHLKNLARMKGITKKEYLEKIAKNKPLSDYLSSQAAAGMIDLT